MFGWIMDRMVERAIPPDVENPAQERIAEEAAANAIRQIAMVSGIAGLFLCAALAALLYGFLPSWQIVHGASQPSEMAARVVTNEAKLRQAAEETERQFQQVAMERDALQGTVADLVARLGEQADPQPQAASAAVVSQDAGERDRLQRTIGDLERQVAELTQKLQAASAVAVVDRSARIPNTVRPSNTPVSAEPQLAYRCGDGRTDRDPANCRARTTTAPLDVSPSPPNTYRGGDGRSVPNPADCRSAGALSPRG